MHYRTDRAREHGPVAPRLGGRSFKPSAKVAEGEFDPDELTRRLYVVLAEQKARARKQRARGEPSSKRDGLDRTSNGRHRDGAKSGREARQISTEPPADLITELRRSESAKGKASQTTVSAPAPDASATEAGHYHHVPNQAAKQFTRTTTVENMRGNNDHIHKLSKRALQFHMEGTKAARTGGCEPALAPAELSRALQQTQTHRDRLSERNQFQRTRILEEAARLDRDQLSPRKHTFEDELSRILPDSHPHHAHPSTTARHARRNSTGNATDLPSQPSDPAQARRSLIAPDASLLLSLDTLFEDILTPPPEELGRFPPPDRTRVDWSQSDESKSRPKLLLLSPLLRKADSLWALRGRRGSKDSSGSGGAVAVAGGENGDEVVAAQSPTTPTAKTGKGFWFMI